MKRSIHQALVALLSLVLVACGGGGGTALQLPGVSGYTLTLTPSATTTTAAQPVTLTAVLRSPAGAPVSGATLTLVSNVGRLNVNSVQTDGAGTAQALLFAGTGGQASGEITVSFTDPDRNLAFRTIAIATMGDETTGGTTNQPTMTLSVLDGSGAPVDSANPVTDTAPGALRATVLDANSNPLANVIVNFSVDSIASISQSSALTDANGQASVPVSAVTSGAGQVRASATVGGVPLNATSVIATLVGGGSTLPTLVSVTVRDSSGVIADSANPVTETAGQIEAIVTQGGNPVPNLRVTFSVTPEASLSQLAALTDANGRAVVPVRAVSSGAATATATAGTAAGSAVFATSAVTPANTVIQLVVLNAAGVSADAANPVTSVPGTLVATVTNNGAPRAGVLVTFEVTDVAALTQTTALTNAAGVASVPVAATVTGAGTATATATDGSVDVAGTRDFATNITAATGGPTLSLVARTGGGVVVDAANPVTSAAPGTLTATVLDAAGAPMPNVIINFTVDSNATLGQSSALTDSNGQAQVELRAAATGAGQARAAATIAGRELTVATVLATTASTTGAPKPYVELVTVRDSNGALSNSTTPVTDAAAGTVSATIRRADGSLATNVLVTFSTGSVAQIAPSTALTDVAGVASVPIRALQDGAGMVTVTAVVDGVTTEPGFAVYMAQTGFAPVDEPILLLSLEDADGIPVSATNPLVRNNDPLIDNSPGVLRIHAMNADGTDAANVIVNIGSVAGTVFSFAQSAVLTDANGEATVAVTALSTGVDQIRATATIAGVSLEVLANAASRVDTTAAAGMVVEVRNAAGALVDSATPISDAAPGTVTAIVRHADGTFAVGVVVTFAATDVATLVQTSALTDATGRATVAITATATGAGSVTATAAALDVSGTATFAARLESAVVDAPVMSLAVLDSTGSVRITADNPLTNQASGIIRATIVDASGAPVPDVLVTFELVSGGGAELPTEPFALTDANGVAELQIRAVSTGAGTVQASATVSGVGVGTLQPYATSFLNGSDMPSIKLEAFNSAGLPVDATNRLTQVPGILRLTVVDGAGAGIPGLIVNFSNATAQVQIGDSDGVMTNAAGVAETSIAATGTGAGFLTASIRSAPGTDGGIDNEYLPASVAVATQVGAAVTTGPIVVLQINAADGNPVSSANPITNLSPGQLRATVTENAVPLPNILVTFDAPDTLVNLGQVSALTNAAGVAVVSVTARESGAGAATASATVGGLSIEDTKFFATSAGATAVDRPVLNLSVLDNTNAPVTASNPITSAAPGKLRATITASGAPVPGVVVTFATAQGSGAQLPQVNALTNAAGIAEVPVNAVATGAGTVTAEATVAQGTTGTLVDVRDEEAYASVLEATAALVLDLGFFDGTTFTPNVLGLNVAGTVDPGTAVIVTADVFDTATNTAYPDQVTVNFTSLCSSDPERAELDSAVTAVGGRALAIYRPKNCVGNDVITATVSTGTQTLTASTTITIAAQDVSNLEFVSAAPETLALRGTGGAGRQETSTVKFKVVGAQGSPLSGMPVCFGLSTALGGMALAPERATSNTAGEVFVTVQAGNVPTPVRVNAYVDDNGTCADAKPSPLIQTVSDVLTVSTGLPAQRNFSLAVNPDDSEPLPGFTYDGVPWTVAVFVADRFSNPVPAGTAVNFWTEHGAIEPSCTTLDTTGICEVNWRSQSPRDGYDLRDKSATGRPFSDRRGRSTIVAYAVGEESFVDQNGNGLFDAGEAGTIGDLSEVIKDTDYVEDMVRFLESVLNEEFVDFNGNGVLDPANGVFDGVLCGPGTLGAGCSGDATVHVRAYNEIVLSSNRARVYLVEPGVDTTGIDYCTPANFTLQPGCDTADDIGAIFGMTGPGNLGYQYDLGDPSGQTLGKLFALQGARSFGIVATDENGNGLAPGTVIRVSTDTSAGSVDTGSSFVVSRMSGLADWFASRVVLKAPTTPVSSDGTVTITVEHTDGTTQSMYLAVDWYTP